MGEKLASAKLVSGLRMRQDDIADYNTFIRHFRNENENELQVMGKFTIVQSVAKLGYNKIYIDVTLRLGRSLESMDADVYGKNEDGVIIGFCEADVPNDELCRKLTLLSSSPRTRVMLIFPLSTPITELARRFPEEFASQKFTVHFLPWVDTDVEGVFKEALEMVTILENRTRMRMLLPLLREPTKKSIYRVKINPKLVYENLPTLMSSRLVRKLEQDQYALTHVGNQVLLEYLAFLQKLRDVLTTEQ